MAYVMEYQRPEFRNFPLPAEELRQLHEDTSTLNQQIRDNNQEIRLLNTKNARTDYQQQLLERLKLKEKILDEKKRQTAQILQTQQHIEQQLRANRVRDHQLRNSLANEYKVNIQQKRRRKEDQKKKEIELQRGMQLYNQNLIEDEMRRKKQSLEMSRRVARQQIQAKEQIKRNERELQLMEKQLYNQRTEAMSNIQSQKESSYKQYYQQFAQNQNRMHNIYEKRAAQQDSIKDYSRQELVLKGIEENRQKQFKEQEQMIQKSAISKDSLRASLQHQIEQKEFKKQLVKEEHQRDSQLTRQQELQNRQLIQQEKQRKKDQQHRYEQGLNNQVRVRDSFHVQSPSNSRGYSMHNPIINPIDFKIGISNPYVVNAYEDTKNRYFGDSALKLRNLALIGNKSLHKWSPL